MYINQQCMIIDYVVHNAINNRQIDREITKTTASRNDVPKFNKNILK